MNIFFSQWFSNYQSLMKLGVETQQVIGLRMLRLSFGGRRAEAESQRMISEKFTTLAEAQLGTMTDIAMGRGLQAPARAIAVVQRRVSANRRRLS